MAHRVFVQAVQANPFHGVLRFGNTLVPNRLNRFCRNLAAGKCYSVSICPKCDPNWDLESWTEKPFDIFKKRTGKSRWNGLQMIPREDRERPSYGIILEEGMVLLKGFLKEVDQQLIVEECRKLGLRRTGFHQPLSYTMMMNLGMHWSPSSGKYTKMMPFGSADEEEYYYGTNKYKKKKLADECHPSYIPPKFLVMITRALMEARHLFETDDGDPDLNIPMMSPDICVVKFYTTHDRRGLLQSMDESKRSIAKGLPIVSMSLGDSAEFLYGGTSNVSEARKVVLESGDVCIFGGPARRIFHGIQSVIHDTAPVPLLAETDFRSGRLDLTFKQI